MSSNKKKLDNEGDVTDVESSDDESDVESSDDEEPATDVESDEEESDNEEPVTDVKSESSSSDNEDDSNEEKNLKEEFKKEIKPIKKGERGGHNKINKFVEKKFPNIEFGFSEKKPIIEKKIKILDDYIYKEILPEKSKGKKCSINGNNYEKQIYKVVKNCHLNEKSFNTQKEEELGGSSNKNDVECNFNGINNIGIEAKTYNTPDWMQCSIKYNTDKKKWEASKKGKIPKDCQNIFNKLIEDIEIFNGKIPPFFKNNITHDSWLKIKSNTNDWNDSYIDIPNNIIKQMYSKKGCKYIQISNYGLYHLGNDICNFNVPEFHCKQEIRVRTKIHTRSNNKGYCNLSVTIACKPKNIKELEKSKHSLDNSSKLPDNLIYKL
jgi:hypothetical protein